MTGQEVYNDLSRGTSPKITYTHIKIYSDILVQVWYKQFQVILIGKLFQSRILICMNLLMKRVMCMLSSWSYSSGIIRWNFWSCKILLFKKWSRDPSEESTEDGITAYSLWENSYTLLACYDRSFVQCQSRDFLTELCCNTIIFLVSVLFYFSPFFIFNVLVCLVF